MNHQQYDLLSIGGFANAAQLSIKALRLYDQLSILKPRYVDPESGYRYYHVDQLRAARLIRMLRQMDMPLATIRQVLAATPTAAEMLVHDYWQLREQQMAQARLMVHDLFAYLRQEATTMALEVQTKTVDPQPIISLTRRVTVDRLDDHIQNSLQTLYALAKAHGLAVTGASFGIYHGPVNNDDDGPMEVCVPVRSMIATPGDVVARELPGGTVAFVRIQHEQCAFPAILAAYDTVYDWIHKHGYIQAEPPREIWLSPPGHDEQVEVAWRFQEVAPTA